MSCFFILKWMMNAKIVVTTRGIIADINKLSRYILGSNIEKLGGSCTMMNLCSKNPKTSLPKFQI